MMRAIAAEFAKLRRARFVTSLSIVVAVVALIGGAVMAVLQNPDTARQLGLLDPKAPNAFMEPTWKGLFSINAASISASWGLLVYGFAAAFLFAREYAEGTAKNALTLPVRREYFVLAKMTVLTAWVAGLALLAVLLNTGVAAALGLRGFSWDVLANGATEMLVSSLMIYLMLPVVGLAAMLGKGYLPPILSVVFLWPFATTLALSGWAKYFPWSIPLTYTGTVWAPASKVGVEPVSWAILIAVFVLGIVAMLVQIDRADNTQ